MSQLTDPTATKSPYPSWCPACGCTDPEQYPFEIGSSIVGCKRCKETWPKEKLAAMVKQKEPKS